MSKKVAIFIDGENFHLSLRDIKIDSNNVLFDKFFNYLLEPTDELLRAYIFRPQSIFLPKFIDKNKIAENYIYSKFPRNEAERIINEQKTKKEFSSEIWKVVNVEFESIQNWIKYSETNFEKINHKYTRLATEHENIEIYRSGILKLNPYQKIKSEKGVDVSLSSKMIEFALTNKIDKAILISGDYDYKEAIQVVKNTMKRVNIVRIKSSGKSSTSSTLRELADKVIDVTERDFKENFTKNNPVK